ncbi:MAG: hypothetical protein AAF745_13100 [Planctomycetota bacterium]
MRTLLLLGLAIGGAFMAGWFTIERDGDRTRIEINKTEVRSDVGRTIDRVQDLRQQREQNRVAAQNRFYPPVQGANYSQPSVNPNNGYGQTGAYPNQNGSYANPSSYQQPGYGGGTGFGNTPSSYPANAAAPNDRWSGAQQPAPWAPNR